MKKLIFTVVIPITLLLKTIITKWWLCTEINGLCWGFPFMEEAPGGYSMTNQIFVKAHLLNYLFYFLTIFLMVYLFNKFLKPIFVPKKMKWLNYSFIVVYVGLYIWKCDVYETWFMFENDYPVKVLESGFHFLGQGEPNIDYSKYEPKSAEKQPVESFQTFINNNNFKQSILIANDDTTFAIVEAKELKSYDSPLCFFTKKFSANQIPFQSCILSKAASRLIPNQHARNAAQLKGIKNITGVTHFFLDHDLTTGFVHPYTQNFYNKLSGDDYVMKFVASSEKNVGEIFYVKKKKLQPTDKLGSTVAYFRQWKLSEIDWKEVNNDILINVAASSFSYHNCPQAKNISKPSLQKQIPILVEASDEGYCKLMDCDRFDETYGGTAVIIWDDTKTGTTHFQDIHNSWKEIFSLAKNISDQFHVDPTIAIGDAGPYSPKIKSDANFNLDVSLIDDLFSHGEWFGAGFGYVPVKLFLFECKFKNDSTGYLCAEQNSIAYNYLKRK